MLCVLYAVRGLSNYFTHTDQGYIDIQPNCSFPWIPDASKNMSYFVQKMNRTEMDNIMEQLMIASPNDCSGKRTQQIELHVLDQKT
ncbi:MAG: hypothetical protein BGN88_13740 [Clostridiales bacterium 43-6]|nr:MAG: hypothetical protein BGN88_13740 [Clostridiales bacterium 43-6]